MISWLRHEKGGCEAFPVMDDFTCGNPNCDEYREHVDMITAYGNHALLRRGSDGKLYVAIVSGSRLECVPDERGIDIIEEAV